MQKLKELVFKTCCYTVSYQEFVVCSICLIIVFVMAFGGQ